MAVDDGGSAFPLHGKVEHGLEGLSIRDYFAGQVIGHLQGSFHAESGAINIDVATARRAYEIADAMIEERKRFWRKVPVAVSVKTISYIGSDGDSLAVVKDLGFENLYRALNPSNHSYEAVYGTWEHWVSLAQRILEIEDRRKAGESDG